MSAIDGLFHDLRARGQKAFIPFVTAGDPDLRFTQRLLRELVARGSHLCEVGIPYSDPIADGPVIQASYTRALERHIRLPDILQALGQLAAGLPAPIITMVSYAIIYRHGLARYVADAKAAGVAGLIVPDLLAEESGPLAAICRHEDLSLIQLVAPTTPRERAVRIAEMSSGFLYYVSIAGITGERAALPPDLVENVRWLRQRTPLPVCIGFGISQPEHVRALVPVADGVIVGSAIVRRIHNTSSRSQDEILDDVGHYVASLVAELS